VALAGTLSNQLIEEYRPSELSFVDLKRKNWLLRKRFKKCKRIDFRFMLAADDGYCQRRCSGERKRYRNIDLTYK